MSILLRLAVLVSCIVLTTLVIATTILSFTVSRVTRDALEQTLQDEAQHIATQGSFSHQVSTHFTDRSFDPIATSVRTCLFPSTHFSDNGLPLSDDGLRAVRGGELWTEAALVDGRNVLVHNRPLMQGGHLSG